MQQGVDLEGERLSIHAEHPERDVEARREARFDEGLAAREIPLAVRSVPVNYHPLPVMKIRSITIEHWI